MGVVTHQHINTTIRQHTNPPIHRRAGTYSRHVFNLFRTIIKQCADMAKKKSTLDRVANLFDKAAKLLKGPYKAVSGAVIAAVLGGILKLTEVTKTFPPPADMLGNIIIFIAVLAVVIDLCKGGLLD